MVGEIGLVPDHSEQDVYLVKLNAQGGTVWEKEYDRGTNDRGVCVQEWYDEYGLELLGYVIVGGTNYGGSPANLHIIFTLLDGTFLFDRIYSGSQTDIGCFIQQTNYDPVPGFIIAGTTSSYGNGHQMWLFKIDRYNGNHLWDKRFGGLDWDSGYCVREHRDGYAIVGVYHVFGGGEYVYLIETDFLGNDNWTSLYTPPNSSSKGYSMKITSDGGYAITGVSSVGPIDNVLIIKADSDGNEEWMKVIDDRLGKGKCIDLVDSGNGGYIICGRAYSFQETYDFHLIKLGWWLAETNDPSAMSYNGNRHLVRKPNSEELHLVYTSEGKVMYTYSANGGTDWSSPEIIGEGKYPAITIGSDDLPSVTWTDDAGGLWYRRQIQPEEWSDVYHLYNPAVSNLPLNSPPSIAIIPSIPNVVHILVTRSGGIPNGGSKHTVENYSFPITNPGQGTFELIEQVYGPSEPPLRSFPSLTKCDVDNSLHAVWQRVDTICYATRDIGQPWNNWGWQFFDYGRYSAHPFVECYGDSVFVVWQRKEGFYNYEEIYRAANWIYWSPPQFTWHNLSQTPTTKSLYPVNANGPYTVYTDLSTPPINTWWEIFYKIRPGDTPYNISQTP